jgi:hypothetical protein
VTNNKWIVPLIILTAALHACAPAGQPSEPAEEILEGLRQIASTEGFRPYEGNPILEPGPEGSFDAGALGSMSVLLADGIFHMYYETWGVRSDAEWDADEYESLQIGHATSRDGIRWTKDPGNPVLAHGGEADFDRTGVWDPYVIYEDGIFKMWYGGGGGSQPNFGWAYATSEDGTRFKKQGLIGIGNQTGVEDCHVVCDPESGLYYMYYWWGWAEPEGLFLVTSPTETGFDFNKRIPVRIEGDDSYMKKFGHVIRDRQGWHMFYSNFVQPHCPNSITRYAWSEDGIHWQAKNRRLVKGHDSEVLKVADDLFLMFSSPQNGFDRAGTDVRLSVYNGTLQDLAQKPAFFDIPGPTAITGKKFTFRFGDDEPVTFLFRPEGEVILSEEGNVEDPYTFNAYYGHDGDRVWIKGEGIHLEGSFEGETLELSEVEEDNRNE